jgi:hypothetical protein
MKLLDHLISLEYSLMQVSASLVEARKILKTEESPDLRRLQTVVLKLRDELNRVLNSIIDNKYGTDNST